ncbi:helix-turn-helix domain-containing protein [Echinicola rosea]|uniref:AraC family transcriptional regulator n=1 Tax=Echinicola rosea TaxID=1807691 RepID=A0ABQ1UZB7_9BACT|nr:helix-turn-helix domain-containing protein [Echinicola rosea]GGF29243.1 AraC family transcriptional regulator [Echinicola rosea]
MEIGLKKKLEDELVLKVSRMKPIIKPTKPHKHAGYHELIFLSKGAGQHTIGDEAFDVVPPTGFYLGPGQVHCWDFSKIPEGYVILFKEEILSLYPKAQSYLFDFPKQFNIPDESDFFHLLDTFFAEFKAGNEMDFLAAYLNLVIIKSSSIAQQNKNNTPSVTKEFAAFRQLVNEHFTEIKNVESYADMLHLSVKKLNEICKSAINATAREVIKERILIEAKNLLTHTNRNVSEIAFELNFTDSSNFVKFFKGQTTLTPLDYRSRAIG